MRRGPWVRWQRGLAADERSDLRCVLRFEQLLGAGRDRAEIFALLEMTEDDAQSLADRVRASARLAEVDLELTIIARVLSALDDVGSEGGER